MTFKIGLMTCYLSFSIAMAGCALVNQVSSVGTNGNNSASYPRQEEPKVQPIVFTNTKFYGFEFGIKNSIEAKKVKTSIDDKTGCPLTSYRDPKNIFDYVGLLECDGRLVEITLLKATGDLNSILQTTSEKLFEEFPERLFRKFYSNKTTSIELDFVETRSEWFDRYEKFNSRCTNRGSFSTISDSECETFELAVGTKLSLIRLMKTDVVMAIINSHEYDLQVEKHKKVIKELFNK